VSTILGVDPGETTGWAVYNTLSRRVEQSGQFATYLLPLIAASLADACDRIVIERPVAHGPTRPQVVECAWIAGRLIERLGRRCEERTRLDVKKALTAATHGEVVVRNDATAWAALLLLHGGAADAKKNGPLHGVRAHERAALAVAYALHCEVK
jgi:hypothetical protein